MTKTNEQWISGQKFDDYLKEHGIYEDTVIGSEIEFLIELIQEKMKSENISKDEICNLILTQLKLIGQKFNIELGSNLS